MRRRPRQLRPDAGDAGPRRRDRRHHARPVWPFWRLQPASERGTSSLEVAIAIPIFLLFIIGTIDFGRAVVTYNASSQAAREGMRAGIVAVPPNPTVTAAPVVAAPQATAIAVAARRQTAAVGSDYGVTAGAGVDERGQYVQVVVSASYQPALGGFLGVDTFPIAATSKGYLP